MRHVKINGPDNAESYLKSTEYLDADHPLVVATASNSPMGQSPMSSGSGRSTFVSEIFRTTFASPSNISRPASTPPAAVLKHGVAFCMGKASSFVALSRAAGVPARIAFQTLESPEKEFLSPEVRALWGGKRGRPLPWHSLGEASLNGRWVKLDATIDAPTAARLGKPYTQEFDGITDIHTIEGPILRENGSYADYPPKVAHWYELVATAVHGLDSPANHTRVAEDDDLWAGPPLDEVRRQAVR